MRCPIPTAAQSASLDEYLREMQALDGVPYERLAAIAGMVLEFCRFVPLRPLP